MSTTELNAVNPATTGAAATTMMKALVYRGPGQRAWEAEPKPE